MLHRMLAVLTLVAIATPATADTRYLAFDPSDRVTTALTRGVTLEVERGWFGAVSVRRIISTTARGSATISRGGPDEARRALPEGAGESTVYSIAQEGDGRGLARALCPGAEATFLVVGRVRAGRPMAMHGAGRWSDGTFRYCVTLSYSYRGEWSLPPRASVEDAD
ncbi:hypothetical protein [Brevundimonas sp.]|uniref:hypothetical protein n=1 Tax=Brevundimonas sp. TaxID=1871086 RepID=UPI00286B8144|nr:hypothetical protein [Brevundimonas sp.]